MSNNTLVQAEHLENFIHALFVLVGMAPEPSRDVAKALLWAELCGIDAHGVRRVGFYLNFIQKGLINTQPKWQVLHDTPAVQVFDANASGATLPCPRHGGGHPLVGCSCQRVECMPQARGHCLALVVRWRFQRCRALGSHCAKNPPYFAAV